MNGWVNTSVWDRLGETQAISIHSLTLQPRAKSTPNLVPILQEAAQGCWSGVLEWVFSAGCEQSPDQGHSTGESFHPQLHLRKAVWRREGKETESKPLTAESPA